MLAEMELMQFGDEFDNDVPAYYEFAHITAPNHGAEIGPLPEDRDEQGPWSDEGMHVVLCVSGFNTPSGRPSTPLTGFYSAIPSGELPHTPPPA